MTYKLVKTALIVAPLLLSIPQANTAPQNWSGAYTGGALGAAMMGKTSYVATQNNPAPLAATPLIKNDTPLKGVMLEIIAGLQSDTGRFIFGGETVLGISGAKVKKRVSTLGVEQEYKAEQKTSIEIAARAGIKIKSNWHLYGRLGFANTGFDWQSPVNEAVTGIKPKQSKRLNAVVFGGGIEWRKNNLIMGVEMKRALYGKNKSTVAGSNGFSLTETFKPEVITTLMFRLLYKIT